MINRHDSIQEKIKKVKNKISAHIKQILQGGDKHEKEQAIQKL